jgi:hypothetical protein
MVEARASREEPLDSIPKHSAPRRRRAASRLSLLNELIGAGLATASREREERGPPNW